MPVRNEDIAAIFEEMADLLEVEQASPFRVRAYRNAARTARSLGRQLAAMLAEGRDLTELPGIGKDLAAKIAEILATGHARALEELHQDVPASLKALLKLPGLGPKRVKTLYQTLQIKDLRQLEQAAKQGRLRQLPGFGAKSEQRILAAIETHRGAEQRFLHDTARRHAEPLVKYLQAVPGVQHVVVAGSYRRGKETVGDPDILARASAGSPVMAHFTACDEVAEVVSQGSTRATVLLRGGLQVDLRVVEQHSLGAALHYFTGSKAHNIQVRRLGQQLGLKINEYGVFKDDTRVAGNTEESVFAAVGLPYIPPELREGGEEIEAARSRTLPKLVRRADLRGDLHLHTAASDGADSMEEMARAARHCGLDYIAITDHSRHLAVARGLDERRLAQQIERIDELNGKLKDLTILTGIEVDILEDGRLDLPASILSQLDLVIGAVHRYFGLSRTARTGRILRAIESRYFTLLAHPSGRPLDSREPYEVEMPAIIAGARERGCYLELDSQPRRLDLTDLYCRLAKQQGVLVSIDSDAHRAADLRHLEGGIQQARRGWLEQADVLNSRPLPALRKRLKATMG